MTLTIHYDLTAPELPPGWRVLNYQANTIRVSPKTSPTISGLLDKISDSITDNVEFCCNAIRDLDDCVNEGEFSPAKGWKFANDWSKYDDAPSQN